MYLPSASLSTAVSTSLAAFRYLQVVSLVVLVSVVSLVVLLVTLVAVMADIPYPGDLTAFFLLFSQIYGLYESIYKVGGRWGRKE